MQRKCAAFLAAALLPAVLAAQTRIGNMVVGSAASFGIGMPPPGSIGAIFCTGLSVSGTVSAPADQSLPFSLAGVTVTVGGLTAPMFAVADLGGYQQINFEVPLGSGPDSTVIVSQNGLQGLATPIESASPGEFFRIGATQFGAFQHASDYSLVTSDNPAAPGELLVGYATGLPAPSPPVPTGQVTPLSPFYQVAQVTEDPRGTTLLFLVENNTPLSVSFLGLAPGEIGVYQINFTLDPQAASGNVPVAIVKQVCSQAAGGPVPCNPLVPGVGVEFNYGQNVLIPVK
jgi:uncharacterized protein (TIGR03437 family)